MANGTIAFDTLSTSGQISGTAKSVDTDYLASGSAKQWTRYNQDTPVINSSLNTSSVADTSTGKVTVNISNAFSSTTAYSTSGSKNSTTYNFTISPVSASQYIAYQRQDGGTYADASAFCFQAVGDLA